MMIGKIGDSATGSMGRTDTASLEQQKMACENEMRQIKRDKNIKPEEKEKKIKVLQEKIKNIERQIAQASKSASRAPQKNSVNETELNKEEARKNEGRLIDTQI